MTHVASDSILPDKSLECTRVNLTLSEILVLFSWKKCGCGRTARVIVWSNRLGGKLNLLASWITHHCEQVFPVFPSPRGESFTLTRKSLSLRVRSKSLSEPHPGESVGKPTLSPLKGDLPCPSVMAHASRSILKMATV